MFKKIITWILYALALVPLIVAKGYFFPYISGKVLFIRWVVAIAAVLIAGYAWYEKSFRAELAAKTKALFKNPVGLFAGLFLLVNVVSSFFAVTPYRAFFGDIERGEGLLGLLFFFFAFVGMGVLFEHKDWIRFFKISLGVSVIMFFDALTDFLNGVVRPASFTGNPIYLAEVFLFALFAAGIVFWEHYKQKDRTKGTNLFWIISSAVVALVSLWGIFITETRGVILGIGVALGITLLYAWWAGKNVNIKSWSVSKIAGYLLLVLVICGGAFFATKDFSFWQRIPGFDRLAHATLTDSSTQTRLISAGVSLQSINPSRNGWQKFLIGWGPENFSIAYNAHYNPQYFEFENKWFDRAHDKIFDVLVMNGVVGLAVYLGIWIFLLWLIMRKREFSLVKAAVLFFGAAYFVQNLTVFDSIITYVLWFAFLAYCVCEMKHETWNMEQRKKYTEEQKKENISRFIFHDSYIAGGFSVAALFFVYALVFWTWVPFSQMSTYLTTLRSVESIPGSQLEGLLASVFTPYTYAQDVIRTSFLESIKQGFSGNDAQKQVILFAISEVKNMLAREPYNARYWANLGAGYDALGKGGLKEYFPLGQEAYQQAQKLAPGRQDMYYVRAYNLGYQGKLDEAIAVLQQASALDDKVATSHLYLALMQISSGPKNYDAGFSELQKAYQLNKDLYQLEEGMVTGYYVLLQHYYNAHDVRAKDCALALEYMVPAKKDGLEMIIKNIDTKVWQNIQFK